MIAECVLCTCMSVFLPRNLFNIWSIHVQSIAFIISTHIHGRNKIKTDHILTLTMWPRMIPSGSPCSTTISCLSITSLRKGESVKSGLQSEHYTQVHFSGPFSHDVQVCNCLSCLKIPIPCFFFPFHLEDNDLCPSGYGDLYFLYVAWHSWRIYSGFP